MSLQMCDTGEINWVFFDKNVFDVETYLSVIDIRKYRVVLTKFRCSNHSLNVELRRQKSLPYPLRFCEFCKFSSFHCIVHEFHMIATYPLYTE